MERLQGGNNTLCHIAREHKDPQIRHDTMSASATSWRTHSPVVQADRAAVVPTIRLTSILVRKESSP
jgi:hypothetical protein